MIGGKAISKVAVEGSLIKIDHPDQPDDRASEEREGGDERSEYADGRAVGSQRVDRRAAAAHRQRRPERDRHSQALLRDRALHLRPGLHLDRELLVEDHLHRRRGGRAAASRLLDRGPRDAQRLPRGRLSDHVRRAADRGAEGQVRPRRHLSHHAERADHLSVPRLPPRCPSDGGDDRGGRRALGLLLRGPRHRGSAQPDDRELPPGGQGADDRRDGLQILGRPAVHVPAQRSELRRELPPDGVRGAVRALQGQPGAGQGARSHLHPARRSRAERLDLDRAPGRLDRRQPLRGDRRRHRVLVGPGAWRRQRGGGRHAEGDRLGRAHPRVHRAAPRIATTRSA